jgi:hypothetical protein
MKKVIRLTESDLMRIVKRVISEQVKTYPVPKVPASNVSDNTRVTPQIKTKMPDLSYDPKTSCLKGLKPVYYQGGKFAWFEQPNSYKSRKIMTNGTYEAPGPILTTVMGGIETKENGIWRCSGKTILFDKAKGATDIGKDIMVSNGDYFDDHDGSGAYSVGGYEYFRGKIISKTVKNDGYEIKVKGSGKDSSGQNKEGCATFETGMLSGNGPEYEYVSIDIRTC